MWARMIFSVCKVLNTTNKRNRSGGTLEELGYQTTTGLSKYYKADTPREETGKVIGILTLLSQRIYLDVLN